MLIQYWLDNLTSYTCRAKEGNTIVFGPQTDLHAPDHPPVVWMRNSSLASRQPHTPPCRCQNAAAFAFTLRWQQAAASRCLDSASFGNLLSSNNSNVLRKLSGTLNYSLIPKFKLCKAKEAENQCTFKVIRDHKWNRSALLQLCV